MRASIILPLALSLLGFVVADGTTIDGATVSDGQTINIGTTVVQTGGDATGSDGTANTADGSSNAAAGAVGASFIENGWLVVGAAMGVAAGGLAFGL